MDKFVQYKNGRWVKSSDATVSVTDMGFSRGIAVFETMRTSNGKAFKLKEHVERLMNSSSAADMIVNVNVETIDEAISVGMKKNNLDDAVIKIILSGKDNRGVGKPLNTDIFIIFHEMNLPKQDKYESGLELTVSSPHLRATPQVKSTDYMLARLAFKKVLSDGADDALYSDGVLIYETTIANIFFVKNGVLLTPKNGILPGITRSTIIDLAHQNGIKVEERDIRLAELQSFDECFVSGSIKGVMSVKSIEDVSYEVNKQVTTKISNLYKGLLEKN